MPRYEVIAHKRVPVRQFVEAPSRGLARRKAAQNDVWEDVPDAGELPVEIVYVEEPIQETE